MTKKALFIIAPNHRDIYGPEERRRVAEMVELLGPDQQADVIDTAPELLGEVQIILSSWGMSRLNERFLAAAPKLEAVFYAAGSIRSFVTEAAWQRGLVICSAWQANAVPVAEYTLAHILLCLKRAHESHRYVLEHRYEEFPQREVKGAYQSTVGLVSLGEISRRVVHLLQGIDVEILAYDPYVPHSIAEEMGIRLVPLKTLFEQADVVSLHAPLIKETEGMIDATLLRLMKPNSAIINTARGGILNFEDFVSFLQDRSDVQAVIDVFDPYEPPDRNHPFLKLPNVYMTPHLAGAVGNERRRLANFMVSELERYLAGSDLHWQITSKQLQHMA